MTEHVRTERRLTVLARRLGVEEYRLGMLGTVMALPFVSALIAVVAA